MKLKTLKDLVKEVYCKTYKRFEKDEVFFIHTKVLKAEAIKWVKHYTSGDYTSLDGVNHAQEIVDFIENFFNITESDLSAEGEDLK